MPNINDIASIAEALEKHSVAVAQDRCVVVRNRNATCRRCVATCSADAIAVDNNEIVLDASACIGCGACAAVCPTEALVSLDPLESVLANAIREAMDANHARAVFACARIASKRTADPRAYAEVPCLSRVGEGAIMEAIAAGAREVLLVDGDCDTCKLGKCVGRADDALCVVGDLLAAQGASVTVSRVTGFPADMLVESGEGLFGTTRRGFFSDAAAAARDTAMTAAKTTLAQEFGYAERAPEIGERLRVTDEGTLPRVRVRRHETIIDAMDAVGEPVVEVIDTPLFGSVAIDAEVCNACGMCAVFCPTGALRRDPLENLGDPIKTLEFSASACVQCGLCADVCWKRALTLVSEVGTAQLFDFEPVTFDLSCSKRRTNSLFGSR